MDCILLTSLSLSLSHSCTVGSMHAKYSVKQADFELELLFSQKYVVFFILALRIPAFGQNFLVDSVCIFLN